MQQYVAKIIHKNLILNYRYKILREYEKIKKKQKDKQF